MFKRTILLTGFIGMLGCGTTYVPYPVETPPSIEFIDPCPTVASNFLEVFFCIDESFYVVYYFIGCVYLIFVIFGVYTTTDDRSCQFTVIENCEVTQ